jgi:hypothetical protein
MLVHAFKTGNQHFWQALNKNNILLTNYYKIWENNKENPSLLDGNYIYLLLYIHIFYTKKNLSKNSLISK